MMTALAGWLVLGVGLPAGAATLLETSEVLAVNAEAAAQLPPSREFTLATAGSYVVTLSDLGVPTSLKSLQVLVTRDLETVAELAVEYSTQPGQQPQPVTATFNGTAGTYRVHVLGTLAADGTGGLSAVSVAPSGGGAAVFEAVDAIAQPSTPAPGKSVLQTTLTIATAGTYRVRALDRAFPSALKSRDVLVLQTSPTVREAVNSKGQNGEGLPFGTADVGTFFANAGDEYELVIVANAEANNVGLYGAIVQGGPSDSVIYSSENPVGQLPPARELNIAAAGTHALTIADLQFPVALQSLSAAVIQNGTFAGSVTGAASADVALSAGPAQLFVFATTATTGALSAKISQGAQIDYQDVHIVDASPDPTTPAIYSFTPTDPVSAGDYTLTVEDLRFPAQLPSVEAAVVQGAAIVDQTDEAGNDSVTLQAGRVRVLVAATPPPVSGTTAGNGVFALALATQPGNQLVLEGTQGVGGLFIGRALNVPAAGRYDVILKDFEFPERLRTSWLAITRGTTLVGQVIGSTSIQNLQLDAGPHVLNFLGQPAENASYGTFGMKVADSLPPPVVTFSASPTSVTAGQTATLQWSATNATSCTASGAWSGSKSITGTQQTAALTTNTTYEIECVGPGGKDDASVTVAVNAPAPGGGGGGGGHMDPTLLVGLVSLLAAARARSRRRMTM